MLRRRNSLDDKDKFRPYLQPSAALPDTSHLNRHSFDSVSKASKIRSSLDLAVAATKDPRMSRSAEPRHREIPLPIEDREARLARSSDTRHREAHHPHQLPSLPDTKPPPLGKSPPKSKPPLQAKYKSKYDRSYVLMLRGFFEEIKHNGGAGITPETAARYRACGLSDEVRHSILSLLQYGQMKFRRLLHATFPHATERDMASMMLLAYPEPLAEPTADEQAADVVERQRSELCEIFRSYDTDGSGCISLSELQEAMRPLGLPREEIQKILTRLDENGDGEISEEEFVNGLYPVYF